MEVIALVIALAVVGVAIAYFTVLKKQEEEASSSSQEICEKCLSNVEEVVKKLLEFKKGNISTTEFLNTVVKFSGQLEELSKRAREKGLPDNIVYALKDASSRLKGFKLSGDEEWKKEVRRIEGIIAEVGQKLDKVECPKQEKVGVNEDIIEKARNLNRILASIDVAVITASLAKADLKDIAKELDRATLLSKEIAEALRK